MSIGSKPWSHTDTKVELHMGLDYVHVHFAGRVSLDIALLMRSICGGSR